ncbi:MAG: hypothetical protein IJW16_05535 [Clostridia bacterium]|nr:hypothetical protein [Clostridia bacterium]
MKGFSFLRYSIAHPTEKCKRKPKNIFLLTPPLFGRSENAISGVIPFSRGHAFGFQPHFARETENGGTASEPLFRTNKKPEAIASGFLLRKSSKKVRKCR